MEGEEERGSRKKREKTNYRFCEKSVLPFYSRSEGYTVEGVWFGKPKVSGTFEQANSYFDSCQQIGDCTITLRWLLIEKMGCQGDFRYETIFSFC